MSDETPTLLDALREAISYSEDCETLLPDVLDDDSPTGYATNPTLVRLRELAEVLASLTRAHLAALRKSALYFPIEAEDQDWVRRQLDELDALLEALLPPA